MINVFLDTEQPDVIVLSEHGLKKEELYNINFHIVSDFSRAHCKRSSGGVVVLVKSGIVSNVLDVKQFCVENEFESAGIEINHNS